MELSEKIQKLRKENNLTQEQFAEKIFVSRTAVSKWETGRGTPSIDSLQMIANKFNIKLDDLLSGEEIVEIVKTETNERITRIVSFADAIVNMCAILAIILPLYKIEADGFYYSTYVGNVDGWQGIAFGIISVAIVICGILEAVLLSLKMYKPQSMLKICASVINTLAIILCILSLHPYPAIFFFVFLIIKGIITIKASRYAG